MQALGYLAIVDYGTQMTLFLCLKHLAVKVDNIPFATTNGPTNYFRRKYQILARLQGAFRYINIQLLTDAWRTQTTNMNKENIFILSIKRDLLKQKNVIKILRSWPRFDVDMAPFGSLINEDGNGNENVI